MNFYLLFWTLDDLENSEVQGYWEGATRDNIDDIIKTEFQKWIQEYEASES